MKPAQVLLIAVVTGLLLNVSCSSDTSSSSDTGALGGPVAGASDDHCAEATPVAVDPAACSMAESAGEEGGAPGSPSEAGVAGEDCNATHDAEYGATLYGNEGDDDDCKYHAQWSSTPIRLNQDFTVTLTTSTETTQEPLEALDDGALPLSRVEIYQPCQPNRRPPAQNGHPKLTEAAPGVFSAGPLRLDQSGRWVIRFHLYESCIDGEHSPHGHIAFFVNVP
jgi:hypothetical protein